ncbi:hypothetical protein FA09DRAFT_218927 [Tilletiopsis washingtonensis]|jgi:hypothetical protein|uniref:Uncharacterized protein n=1 Tax=Tilletiopsis washingtonensis TaxID=58919 RepID=A0A316ZE32_9BASI|nr:hypothetical protein FA09DRAFT_218927 [Tilletiopsis washingtonensis]PWN99789.1 hypothetical protein FA09DRAFT_218927 [Tilletiopsis washingtonensis]
MQGQALRRARCDAAVAVRCRVSSHRQYPGRQSREKIAAPARCNAHCAGALRPVAIKSALHGAHAQPLCRAAGLPDEACAGQATFAAATWLHSRVYTWCRRARTSSSSVERGLASRLLHAAASRDLRRCTAALLRCSGRRVSEPEAERGAGTAGGRRSGVRYVLSGVVRWLRDASCRHDAAAPALLLRKSAAVALGRCRGGGSSPRWRAHLRMPPPRQLQAMSRFELALEFCLHASERSRRAALEQLATGQDSGPAGAPGSGMSHRSSSLLHPEAELQAQATPRLEKGATDRFVVHSVHTQRDLTVARGQVR